MVVGGGRCSRGGGANTGEHGGNKAGCLQSRTSFPPPPPLHPLPPVQEGGEAVEGGAGSPQTHARHVGHVAHLGGGGWRGGGVTCRSQGG